MKIKLLFWSILTAVTVLAFLPTYEPLPDVVSYSDKLNHVAAFFTLYLLHTAAFPLLSAARHSLLLIGYGIFIEVVQAFLPTRSSSVEDLVADSIGIFTAILFQYLFLRFVRPSL